jgi:hypothetical protein
MIEYFSRGKCLSPYLQCLLVLFKLIFNLIKLYAALILLYLLTCIHKHQITGRHDKLLRIIQTFKGNAPKLINQLIFNKESANVCEIDVTEDTSNDLSRLLFDDFWNNICLKVHHVVGKVGFNEGLHNGSLCLFLNKHLNDLHNLVVGSLSPQVISPLFMFCLACYLFWGGGIGILSGH